MERQVYADGIRDEKKRSSAYRLKVKKLLNEILDFQVANRGTKSAFYSCYTYGPNDMPKWVNKAEKLLKKAEEDD